MDNEKLIQIAAEIRKLQAEAQLIQSQARMNTEELQVYLRNQWMINTKVLQQAIGIKGSDLTDMFNFIWGKGMITKGKGALNNRPPWQPPNINVYNNTRNFMR